MGAPRMSEQVAGASKAFMDLAARSGRELEAALREGSSPSVDALLGYEYRGYNHGALAGALGIRKFFKGFFTTGDGAFGFNVRARRSRIEGDWIAVPDDSAPRRFAFFGVVASSERVRREPYADAVLLDYGLGGNRRYGLATRLRDHVVRVDEGSDDLLLGKAHFALGDALVPAGYFLLERHRPFEADAGFGLTRERL
jgi:hypothetical protein